MRYFANPCTAPAVQKAMRDGVIGCIETPRQGSNRVPPGAWWCADNGCFGKGYPGDAQWRAWLASHAGRERCMFAVAPDVVGDFAATWERSRPHLEFIRSLGIPAALVAQDGMEHTTKDVWDEIDCLFVGGTDAFKLGPGAAELVAVANSLGKWTHMGRVNSFKRFRYARSIGCDSVDGTYLVFGPDKNLPRLLRWLRHNEQHELELEL